jgi:RNA polymerase sigma-70 factor (ECF subfamily)
MQDEPLNSRATVITQAQRDDEAELIARIVHRDVTAYATIYDRYVRLIYALAAHTLGRTDAEEIVQETFLRLWHKAAQFDPTQGSVKGWLLTIARNLIIDASKQRDRHHTLLAADSIDQLLGQPAALAMPAEDAINVEDEAALNERAAMLKGALQTLPEEQRRALVLSYFTGMSHAIIAEHLGWPLGTVKKRIQLGLQKLRHALVKPPAAGEQG